MTEEEFRNLQVNDRLAQIWRGTVHQRGTVVAKPTSTIIRIKWDGKKANHGVDIDDRIYRESLQKIEVIK